MAAKKQDVKAAPKRKAAKKPFDFQRLRRMALWAIAALCAVALAGLTSRSEAGAERLAVVLASLRGQSAPPPFDPRVETRKLANGLRALSADNEQLRSQLSAVARHTDAVEHHVDDVAGSLGRQIEAVKAEAEAPRPADTPPAAPASATPGVTSTTAAPAPLPATSPTPLPPAPPIGSQKPSPAKPTVPNSSSLEPNQYGVDIGSAVSVAALQARWTEIRAAHPQLFQGLTAMVVTRGTPQSDRSELRLVLGPLPNSDAAARLCTSLAPYRVFCQPTGFDRQHVALQ